MTTNKEIINYLSSKATNVKFIDKLKIKYRPLICPFYRLLDYASGKQHAFDIGCGSGQFASLLAKFTGISIIEGVEIDQRLVNNANKLVEEFKGKKTLTFAVFDGKSLPSSLANAQIVYLIDVMHHIPKPQQQGFLKEIFSKMGSGAVLVFKDINASSPLVVVNKVHDLVFAGEIGNELPFKTATEWVKDTGFTVKESYTQQVFLYPHFFLVCEKP